MDSTIRKPNAILATLQQLWYSLVYSTAVPLLRSAEVNQTFDLITAYGSKFQNGDTHKTNVFAVFCAKGRCVRFSRCLEIRMAREVPSPYQTSSKNLPGRTTVSPVLFGRSCTVEPKAHFARWLIMACPIREA